jgi:anti-sigma regulatory factor (Ser/Thr protein kinase)
VRFQHQALLYDGPDRFAATVAPFVLGGVEAGEPTMVVLREREASALRRSLGARSSSVRFADMDVLGRNPGRIIPAWQDFIDEHPERPVRGVGQPIWPGRGGEALVEAQLHEALLNVAFEEAPAFRLLCPYDRTTLDPSVVHEAGRTHGCGCPDDLLAPFDAPLPPPAAPTRVLAFDRSSVYETRRAVRRRAEEAGLDDDRTWDLVLAVNELATNSIRHGGGNGILRTWIADDELVCEVKDRGRVRDPLVGRRRPAAVAEGGWGLYVTHQLCDLVQLRSGPGGTVVRVRMALSAATDESAAPTGS